MGSRIFRAALWILGEYCTNVDDIQLVMTQVRQSLGDVSSIPSIKFSVLSLTTCKFTGLKYHELIHAD